MQHAKRGRGRPKGSGLPDGDRLDRVADLLIARPQLKPTTAIKQTDPAPSEADLRRLQIKWKAESEARLAAARDRQATKREAQAQRSAARRSGGSGLGAVAAMERQMRATQRLLDLTHAAYSGSPLALAARGTDRTSQILRAACESPLGRTMRAAQNSPVMRATRALEDTPTMRLVRQMEDSPTMRLIREMENSPTMRLIRDMEKLGL
ncbi:hypothetical protein ACWKV8_10695 [Brevundimonas diminuta ATCC 11568]